MSPEAIITLATIVVSIILFATEWITADLVAILAMSFLTITGVISPDESIMGFSNKATITVAFMFILSAAILKTGALQVFSYKVADVFKKNYTLGMFVMILMVAIFSAFINNTPIVAVFIPVVIQIANSIKIAPTRMLIPLAFGSTLGGTCTLIGTSTNIVINGIAKNAGLPEFSFFEMSTIGIIITILGAIYLVTIGDKLLPNRHKEGTLEAKFGMRDYITDITILPTSDSVNKKIMDSILTNELNLDIIEVKRNGSIFNNPTGDFVLKADDILKVNCNIEKIKQLKDIAKIQLTPQLLIGEDNLTGKNSTLVELVVSADSDFIGQTLKELDFRRIYRSTPLAIKNREEILRDEIYDVKLKAGDIILSDVKSHYVKELKVKASEQKTPFYILSEDEMIDFKKKNFAIVMSVVLGVIFLASFEILDIMVASIIGVSILVLLNKLTMKDAYKSVSWKIIFLLAGSLSMGVAMHNSGLDQIIAKELIGFLIPHGEFALVGGILLITMILTEIMSNNATAALIAPIAIATSHNLGISPTPLLITVMIGASAGFMTPIGYQTNMMVYAAGQYKFFDFTKVGIWLSLIVLIVSSILIPILYPFHP